MLMLKLKNFESISIILLLFYTYCECRSSSSSSLTNYTNIIGRQEHRSHRFQNANVNPHKAIESNSIQRLPNTSPTTSKAQKTLKRVFLSNRDITCNDGSQAGFYLRKSLGSRRWVVFFEGGWHCYDHKSCRTRWLKMRSLMTSAQWPETRDVGGILSPSPVENPYWHNANHVFVPYCSSDSWSGTRTKPETREGLRFMGSLIFRQVIADLIPLGLGHSQGADLLLAGSSAGGLGVVLNLDKIRTFLQEEKGLNVNVRGVSDSGWFLDREPYIPGAVAASEAVRQGWKLWNGALPEACVAEHYTEPWRCYFGHRLYNTLKSPLFVFQWLFDEAQMRADSVGAPVTPQQWDYIHDMGGALRKSLENVTAVFAPSCIGHSVLTKKDWLNIKIDDISFPDALRCWEQASIKDKKILRKSSDNRKKKKKLNHKKKNKFNNQELTLEEREQRRKERRRQERKKLTPEERELRRLERRERRRQERLHAKMEQQKQTTTTIPRAERSPRPQDLNSISSNKNLLPKIIENEPTLNHRQHHRRKNHNAHDNSMQPAFEQLQPKRKQHNQHNPKNNKEHKECRHGGGGRCRNQSHNNNNNNNNHNSRNRLVKYNNQLVEIKEPSKCSIRLLERCSWPQCNKSCPTITNPVTGEEMKILELLSSFGLDIDGVATALGVDIQTLNNMEHYELLNMLTQTPNS